MSEEQWIITILVGLCVGVVFWAYVVFIGFGSPYERVARRYSKMMRKEFYGGKSLPPLPDDPEEACRQFQLELQQLRFVVSADQASRRSKDPFFQATEPAMKKETKR